MVQMSEKRKKRVLITQRSLFAISGSEITVLEISRHYRESGAEVLVYTHGASDYWADILREEGLRLVVSGTEDAEKQILDFDPTVVWICHSVIPPGLIRSPCGIKFIFLHLSSFEPLEFVRHPRVEGILAGRVLFVAQEALKEQRNTGLLRAIPDERIDVWNNPVPEGYFQVSELEGRGFRKLLIISNHLSEALSNAIPKLREQVEVRILGSQTELGATPKLVSPEDFEWADAVVSIGKSVQMGIAASRPVFCYDIHGGPGWLDLDNIDRALEFNFSGRGFREAHNWNLVSEIVEGFPRAQAAVGKIRERFGDRFRLSERIPQVEQLAVAIGPHVVVEQLDQSAYALAEKVERGYINAVEARSQTVEYLETLNQIADARSAELEIQLAELSRLDRCNYGGLRWRPWRR